MTIVASLVDTIELVADTMEVVGVTVVASLVVARKHKTRLVFITYTL